METPNHPYEFKLIKAKEITYNKLYQRNLDKAMIKRIFTNFDYHEVNPAKVVYHDGLYFAFDGQHTVVALHEKFGDNYLVPCLVYYDVPTWVEEAILFEKINAKKERRAVSTVDLWKSKNNRGEEKVTSIRRIVEKNGFTIAETSRGNIVGQINALDALGAIFVLLGEELFDETLQIIHKAWHGNPTSLQSPILRGMATFVKLYHDSYKVDRLSAVLSQKDPAKIKSEAQELKSQSIRTRNDIAFRIASIYNSQKYLSEQNRLDISKVLK